MSSVFLWQRANRNIYHIARAQLLCRFAPFLIVTSTSHTDEDPSAAAFGVMNVPVITAAGFKGHIANTGLLHRKRCEIALSDKIFCKGVIGCADVPCSCQMVLKGRIRQPLRHQRHHCYNAAVSQGKLAEVPE